MANTYEKLVAAGAPAIVEPLFYRLYEELVGGNIVVEVRERRQYKGSDLKARLTVSTNGVPALVAERVAEAATEAVMELDYKSTLSGFLGVGSSTGREDV